VVALRIAKERFFTLIDEFPEMAVEMLRELARRLEVTTVRLREAHAKLGGAAE
jgi:CRP-like cAMP-binding protein